jgi:hypothetical protein
MEEEMKNVVIGLIVMLALGSSLIGCDNPANTEEKYLDVKPIADLTLPELIDEEGGALFQNASRSLRFFGDGTFQVFNMGLFMFMQDAATYGSKYVIDGNTIKIYRAADPETTPFYTITYTLTQHNLQIVSKTETAPDNTNLPLGTYSYGMLPQYKP